LLYIRIPICIADSDQYVGFLLIRPGLAQHDHAAYKTLNASNQRMSSTSTPYKRTESNLGSQRLHHTWPLRLCAYRPLGRVGRTGPICVTFCWVCVNETRQPAPVPRYWATRPIDVPTAQGTDLFTSRSSPSFPIRSLARAHRPQPAADRTLHIPLLAGTIPHNSIQSLCYSPTIATIAPQRAAVGLRTGNGLSKMGRRESCNCGIHMLVRSPAHGCQLIERHRIEPRQLSSSMHHTYGALRAPSTNLHRLGGSEGC
jgi:hypothetical protein